MTKGEVWYRLELLTDDPNPVIDRIYDTGALGVEVQDRDTYMDDGSIAPVPDGMTRVIAFFDEPVEFDHPSIEIISNARYDDRSWETEWMKYFHAEQVSSRITVGPPWEEFDAPVDGIRIEIEPGMAFGTGTHETTRLCLRIVDELFADTPPASFLDVGCGSGILSIAAVGLGVSHVAGVDVDETAVEVAAENARHNGVGASAHFSTTPLRRLGTCEFVVANILAHILEELADDLQDRVASGGTLVVSGITTEQADGFLERFAVDELSLARREEMGDWVAFVFARS